MNFWIARYLAQQKQAIDTVDIGKIWKAIDVVRTAIQSGRTIFVIGNGGSAANASHLVTDLVKCGTQSLGRPVRAISLASNAPLLTALGNDYGYEETFALQLEALAHPRDVLISLSVSGNSPNVIRALQTAKRKEVKTIALIGQVKGIAIVNPADFVDIVLEVKSPHYGRVEDTEMMICHIIAYSLVENPNYFALPPVKPVDISPPVGDTSPSQ